MAGVVFIDSGVLIRLFLSGATRFVAFAPYFCKQTRTNMKKVANLIRYLLIIYKLQGPRKYVPTHFLS